MTNDRIPKRIMFGWVQNARERGRPRMTYGATLAKHLQSFQLPVETAAWVELAKDRLHWRQSIQPGRFRDKAEEKEKERGEKRKKEEEERERTR